MTTWDAATYDTSFAYVPHFGTAVLDLLDPQAGESIVDLGCGSGELTAAIAARGAHVVGVDSSPEMLDRARERFPHLELRLADGHEFDVDRPVDAVFSNAALHWMTDPDAVVAAVRSALRDGGRFVAEMGAAGNVAQLVAALRAAAFQLDLDVDLDLPWYFPTPGEQAARLEQVGFTVRLMQYVDRPTPLLDCRDGAADWWRMFGPSVLAQVPADRVDELLAAVNEIARPSLVDASGVWVADYVRLRFVAEVG
ncbi:MAG: class I SAM-dependent methyltransferase [Actinomycetes bacterium]